MKTSSVCPPARRKLVEPKLRLIGGKEERLTGTEIETRHPNRLVLPPVGRSGGRVKSSVSASGLEGEQGRLRVPAETGGRAK